MRELVDRKLVDVPLPPPPPPAIILLLAVPVRLFCLGSLVVLDVVFGYLLFFLLDLKQKIGKQNCFLLFGR